MRMCGVWGHPNIVQHVLDTQRVTTSSRSVFDCLCSLGPPAAENVRNSSAHGTVQTVISALHTTTPALPGMLYLTRAVKATSCGLQLAQCWPAYVLRSHPFTAATGDVASHAAV